MQIRNYKNVAIAVAKSDIAAILADGGRTAHSVLKLPLNINNIEYITCTISINIKRGFFLRKALKTNDIKIKCDVL